MVDSLHAQQGDHAERAHARLSPSSAHRWLHCPGSIALLEAQDYKDVSGEAAERGTAMHEMLEKCLREGIKPRQLLGLKFNGIKADKDMARTVQEAVEVLAPLKAASVKHGLESKMSIPATGEFGTIDLWAALAKPTLHLHVRDFKSGRKAVAAKLNEQMMLYSLGVIAHITTKDKVLMSYLTISTPVTLGIVQPNAVGADTEDLWTTTVGDLLAWGQNKVRPVVDQINAGTAKCKAGDHCHHCKVRNCETLARAGAKEARMDWADFINPKAANPAPPRLSTKDLSALLARVPMLKALIEHIQREAMLALVRKPGSVPDWKVVEGRTHRKWTDPDAVMARLVKAGFDIDDVAPRAIAGLKEVAALLPPAKRDQFMERHTMRPRGKPALAPASDKRPAIASNAAEDFASDLLQDDELED